MRVSVLSALALAVFVSAAAAAEAPMPAACVRDAQSEVNYRACADATASGDPLHTLSLINLGTQAFLQNNWGEAVRLYDEARPPSGQQLYSDANFHAYRASAYQHVGRLEEALWDARAALSMLRDDDGVPEETRRLNAALALDQDTIYALIGPVLKEGNDPEFASALAVYLAIPATDWYAYANRAGVLEQIGELDSALEMSERALALESQHPGVLNNHCYILTRANRAGDALPFCEAAVRGAPDIGAVRHSLASALAQLGRCGEADAALADARRLDPTDPTYREALACTARS